MNLNLRLFIIFFMVNTGLKQGGALSPLSFNIALENVKRSAQRAYYGIDISTRKINLVTGFC